MLDRVILWCPECGRFNNMSPEDYAKAPREGLVCGHGGCRVPVGRLRPLDAWERQAYYQDRLTSVDMPDGSGWALAHKPLGRTG